LEVIRNPPEALYLLAVQPEPMEAKKNVSNFAEIVCGPETKTRFCNGEDDKGATMTVSETSWENAISPIAQSSSSNVPLIKFHCNSLLESKFLRSFDFEFTGVNKNGNKLSDELTSNWNVKPGYQSEITEMLAKNKFHAMVS
jgi:hypothetical protein